jgi:hypothetical protein
MKLLAAKQFNKVWFEDGMKHRLIVKSELVHLEGNSNAHFSITGEVIIGQRTIVGCLSLAVQSTMRSQNRCPNSHHSC